MPTYPGISSEAFRHPMDRQAEQALRSVPGFDLLARKFVEFVYERPQYVYLMGNAVQVGPRQYATVYQMFREAVRDLDVHPEPNLFISQTPLANAYALGQEQPSVVLNGGLLDLLDEQQLRTVIAHELGHIKCGHTTLTHMAIWTLNLVFGLATMTFGFSNLVSTGLLIAFYEWLRKAELTADRAALLVTDNITPIMQSMMQFAGGSSRYGHELSLNEFIRQAERYQELDHDNLNQVYKFLLYNNFSSGVFLTHPFTVERVRYIQEWATSEEYQQIKAGNYRRAGAEGSVDVNARDVSAPPPPSPQGSNEVDELRRQIQELQAEIDRARGPQS